MFLKLSNNLYLGMKRFIIRNNQIKTTDDDFFLFPNIKDGRIIVYEESVKNKTVLYPTIKIKDRVGTEEVNETLCVEKYVDGFKIIPLTNNIRFMKEDEIVLPVIFKEKHICITDTNFIYTKSFYLPAPEVMEIIFYNFYESFPTEEGRETGLHKLIRNYAESYSKIKKIIEEED